VVSRLKYSLDDNELLEALAGLEYESCCWGLRLVARRYLRSRSGDERDALYLELNLKGLGSFGRQPQPMFYDEAD
jgi:LPS-assembly protein